MEFRTAGFAGWNARDRSMLITTRFGNTAQLHRVAMPMGAREQLSFEAEPVGGCWSPNGDVLGVQKDIGGNEFFQLYTLADGQLRLLTDGRSRNEIDAWSHDGRWIGYSSTRRNGTDTDLYVVDPRDPSTDRMVAQVSGGGWGDRRFLARRRPARGRDRIYLDHQVQPLPARSRQRRDDADRRPQPGHRLWRRRNSRRDGTLWVTSDEGSDFQRLGTDRSGHRRASRRCVTDINWDVDSFDIADDGSFIAFVTNEAGISRLQPARPAHRPVAAGRSGLPAGMIGGVEIAPWGAIGFSLTSARSAADAYSVDPQTLARDPLDAERNRRPRPRASMSSPSWSR